jgi:histidine triad (HIT) family protein
MHMSENCIFCKIVRKEAPSSVVYEDSEVLAFMDIRPVSEGHTLVIPKQHFENVFDSPEEQIASVHRVAKRIAAAVKEATKADGISIVQQNGKAAGQDVFHLHVHVIPRFEGVKMPRFGEIEFANRNALDLVAAKIIEYL